MNNMVTKLSSVAALLGVIGAIGAGFVQYGKLTAKIEELDKRKAIINETVDLSKEDLFSNNNNLNAYLKTDFYKSKDIYTDTNSDFFNQIDLGVYNKEIYGGVTLSSYTQNDPVEVHRVQLQEAVSKTRRLQLELEAMKK